MSIRKTIAAALLGGSLLPILPSVTSAQDIKPTYSFDLPSQDLNTSLRALGRQAGLEVIFEAGVVAEKRAPALRGSYALSEALQILLRKSGLEAQVDGGAVLIRGRSGEGAPGVQAATSSDIVVTGSHILGAQSTAVVTTVTAEDMRNAGQNDLGEMARSLPQNFGGGQNPGVGNSQGASNLNVNVNGASTFNLRGIGNAATLTLLNGNRLSYTGVSGAVDISTIPIGAVDRVEVVTGGASAIYGADAVAGVVNIILKPDYRGLTASARLGGATDGGDFQQQYSLVGGTRWGSGGLIGTYDYARNTAIRAGQRSYTSTSNPQTYIFPDLSRHSALVSVHQDLGPSVTLRSVCTAVTNQANGAPARC